MLGDRLEQTAGTSFDARHAAGDTLSDEVAEGAAYCWGYNQWGQIGDGTTRASHVPAAVDRSDVLAGKTVTAIAAGTQHTCVVADDAAYCWGDDFSGQLGYGSVDGRLPVQDKQDSPVPMALDPGDLPDAPVTAITAGDEHTCVLAGKARPPATPSWQGAARFAA